jgi:hypothetical protein
MVRLQTKATQFVCLLVKLERRSFLQGKNMGHLQEQDAGKNVYVRESNRRMGRI